MPDQNEEPWGDKVDCMLLAWNAEFLCKNCGISLQFTARFVNENQETNNAVREITRIKNCMFCGSGVDKNDK